MHGAWDENIDLAFGPAVVLAEPQDAVVCGGVAREFEEEIARVGADNEVLEPSGVKNAQNCGPGGVGINWIVEDRADEEIDVLYRGFSWARCKAVPIPSDNGDCHIIWTRDCQRPRMSCCAL